MMLSSDHSNLPSLWSFFNPANPHQQLQNAPQMQFNHIQQCEGLSHFPQHIELEFEESIIRKSAGDSSIDQMRIKSSPDSRSDGFHEPSYCYMNNAVVVSDSSQVTSSAPPPPTCVSQVVTSQSLNPHIQSSINNNMIHQIPMPLQQPFDLSQATTPPYQRCSPDTTSQIPSVSDYPGEFGFTMSYGSSSANVAMSSGKGALWTFSEQTQKLYVKMAATCPVKFQTNHRVPQGCFLRAMSVFKQPEHVKQVVIRCPNHAHGHSKDSFNEGHPAPSHLIRCEHASAEYQEDPVNGRQSVVVPFDSPQVGTDFVVFLYNFMCYGSCVGGLNRRPIQVVFTLEKEGHILGRRAVEVRICACPSRDRKSEENALNPLTAPKRGEKRGSKALALRDSYCVPSKRKRTDGGSGGGSDGDGHNSDIFYVPVKGLYYYNLVTALYKQLCMHNGDSAAASLDDHPPYTPTAASDHSDPKALLPPISTNSSHSYHSVDETKESPSSPPLADTPPVSPSGNTESELQFEEHPGFTETSITAFLSKLGCSYAVDCFLANNILHVGQLLQLSDQDIMNMKLDESTQNKILCGRREYLNGGVKSYSAFSDQSDQLMIVRTASNSSMTILPNGDLRQTRYTLHHSVSLLKSGNSFEVKNNCSL